MSFADTLRRIEALVAVLTLGGRTLLGLDTNPVPAGYDHITKVDPEEEKALPLAFPLYLSHTSAVSVGGSRDVTERNTEETFDLVNAGRVPAFHEPSAAEHVTSKIREMAAFMAVPEVLNGDSESLVGTLGKGIEHVREDLGPAMIEEKLGLALDDGFVSDRLSTFAAAWMLREAVFEAYIIMNVDSAAAREANVTAENLLSPQEAKERAMAAEYHLGSEIIYLEYSGTFGGQEAVDILEAIDEGVSWSRIWYGGGLDDRGNTNAVLDAGADAVVVGNVFHEIADSEADLYERAVGEFDGVPEQAELREWVEETVDVAETPSARYLSTVPDLPGPERQAVRYLAEGIGIALELREIAAGLDDPGEAAIRRALRDDPPGEAAFGDVLDDDAREVAHGLALCLLAGRFDVDVEDGFAARHLGIEL